MLENYLFPLLETHSDTVNSYTSSMVPSHTRIFMLEFYVRLPHRWSDHADLKFIQYLRHCSVVLTLVTQINCYFQVSKVSKKYLKCTSLSLTFERWFPFTV